MRPHGTWTKYVNGCRCQPCREAGSAYGKARRVATQETARRREAKRVYYLANRETKLAQGKAWKLANREGRLVQMAAYDAAHRDAVTARGRAWRKANPERTRENDATRRARVAGAFVESINPGVVYERDRGVCQICDLWILADERWHVDHIHPISKGGEHSYANVQLAHAHCNQVKAAKVPA